MINNNSNPEAKMIERRITSLFFILVALSLIIAFRLFQKSVLENKSYLAEAKSQHFTTREVPAHRGNIYVKSYGLNELYPIATNLSLYAVSVIPRHVKDEENVARELSKLIDLEEKEILEKIKGSEAYIPPLAHKVTKAKARKIAKKNLDGVFITPEEWRYYPEGDLAAHVIGYVDAEGKGNYGIEGFYDEELRGDSGAFFAEKDVKGRYIAVSGKSEPQDGKSLVLSIDRSVQNFSEELIKRSLKKYGAKEGEIIILNPKTGEIIAMASSYSFDPNEYGKEAEERTINIFNNPNIAHTYEPGSVLKVVTMAAGIDSGSVLASTEESFGAYVEVQDEKIYTWDKKAHGRQNMTEVLETSNNVGIVFVEQRMGKDTFYDYFRNHFGFGSRLGIDLDSEAPGTIEPRSSFRDIKAANMSFGQGLAITSLQLATSFGVIANSGKLMEPHMVKEMIEEKNGENEVVTVKPKFIRQVTSKESADIIRAMLVSVVERGYGQAAKIPGYKIAGKTGTAQVPGPGGYYEDRAIHSFAGFAPADDPRFIAVVKLDEPKTSPWSSYTTTYVFKELAEYLFRHYQISPTE